MGGTRTWRLGAGMLVAGALAFGAPTASATTAGARVDVAEELAAVKVRYGGRAKKLADVSDDLAPAVIDALETWMAHAEDWGFETVLPEHAHAVIFGITNESTLDEAAETADETWKLYEDLQPPASDDEASDARESAPATVFFLFDEQAHRSEVWGELLELLVEKKMLVPTAASSLRNDPTSLTQRDKRLVLQAAYDMAGDASAGDDEFRLNNEIAHKLTWMILADRFGKLPESFRWGAGYVAEQRLFRSIYQFNATGFVAAADHFDWPKKTRETLGKVRKLKEFDLAEEIVRDDAVGQAQRPQMIAWATLDYLLKAEPERLAELLDGLAGLHDEADEYGMMMRYAGDEDETVALVSAALDGIDAKDLEKHLKRVK